MVRETQWTPSWLIHLDCDIIQLWYGWCIVNLKYMTNNKTNNDHNSELWLEWFAEACQKPSQQLKPEMGWTQVVGHDSFDVSVVVHFHILNLLNNGNTMEYECHFKGKKTWLFDVHGRYNHERWQKKPEELGVSSATILHVLQTCGYGSDFLGQKRRCQNPKRAKWVRSPFNRRSEFHST